MVDVAAVQCSSGEDYEYDCDSDLDESEDDVEQVMPPSSNTVGMAAMLYRSYSTGHNMALHQPCPARIP